ncbi:head GIN domain-containing protein [Sphingomonas sp. MJ1 (PH-R8)]|uniref:head GIN domain-containing protein n=1 Tax=Sphingomonas sp. MJ1 (PH-R8) TaxID=3112950 RepID=UPI003A8B931D
MACLSLAACSGIGESNHQHADTVQRSFEARDFTAVALEGPDNVEIRTGGAFAIEARGEPAVLDQLLVRSEGGTLRIGRTSRQSWPWPLRSAGSITVQMPEISAASATGSGAVTLDRAENFSGSVSGSADLTIGMLGGRTVRLANTGSGTIAAAGAVDLLSAEVKGSGDITAPQLRAEQAAVVLQGSGRVEANVAGPARVTLDGSGTVDLGDMALCTSTLAGSGTVRCAS